MAHLSHKEVDLLMEVQYDFPIVDRPFEEVGRRLGIDEEAVIEMLRGLVKRGVLKRIGAVLNYRSRGLVAALVGMAVPPHLVDEVAAEVNRDPYVSHNFLREYEPYNLWYVTKANTREDLEAKVRTVAEKWGLDYVVLYSQRTYRVDVRFDLYRGVSRVPLRVLPENPPTVEDTGMPMDFFRYIRSIPLVQRPFAELREKLGMSVDGLVETIRSLRDAGVIRDFHATLDSSGVGFNENAMVVFNIDDCGRVVSIPEATHIVKRNVVPGKWGYNCYFMMHGINRNIIMEVAGERLSGLGVGEYRLLFSVRDLLGGREMARRVESVAD